MQVNLAGPFSFILCFCIHSVALKPPILASASFALYRQWIFLFLLLTSHYVPLVYIDGRQCKISRYSLHCPLEQLNFSAIPWPGARQGMEEETPVHGFPATEGCQSRKVRGALSQLILSLEGELANLPNGG